MAKAVPARPAGNRGALRRDLRLASEQELPELFRDCAPGAVSPVGAAYDIPTVWDRGLGDKPDVYSKARAAGLSIAQC